MFKKTVVIILSLIILLLYGYHIQTNNKDYKNSSSQSENLLPLQVMVNNHLYQYSKNVDFFLSDVSDGKIEAIVFDQIPCENNQANFGNVGMEYWNTESNELYIKLDDSFLLFTQLDN